MCKDSRLEQAPAAPFDRRSIFNARLKTSLRVQHLSEGFSPFILFSPKVTTLLHGSFRHVALAEAKRVALRSLQVEAISGQGKSIAAGAAAAICVRRRGAGVILQERGFWCLFRGNGR